MQSSLSTLFSFVLIRALSAMVMLQIVSVLWIDIYMPALSDLRKQNIARMGFDCAYVSIFHIRPSNLV